MLRPADAEALKRLGLSYKVSWQNGFTLLQIRDYPTGEGLAPDRVTLLLRLPAGFPDVHPDMFWVDPPLHAASGGMIAGTQVQETHLGRSWQRWSRHVIGNWRPGIDNLSTYLAYVRRCLDQEQASR
jgi:hypothetical protein